ncbi:MAG: hypothetical protein GY874_08640 [Desulfobacteraceae bacterium]|nr:hypothetical protein [Desulfobacteraceae bacterium]
MTTIEIAIGALIVIINSGCFLYMVRRIHAQIDKKAEKEVEQAHYMELKKALAEKQQIAFCRQTHAEVKKELSRGERLFSELMKKIESLQQEQAKTNTFLARLEVRISAYVEHVIKN